MGAATLQTHTIGVPGEYFRKMAKADYRNWRQALGREFLQNSADAGATEIAFTFDNASRTLIVEDNGSGMAVETIVNKLLVLGGSEKPAGAVGGFGKAKELLFFSWDSYEIHSRDNVVIGQGATYQIDKTNHRQGTKCRITFQSDEDMWYIEYGVREALGWSQVKARVTLNGQTIPPLRRGRLVADTDWGANVYLTKSVKSDYMFVRLNGVCMFRQFIGSGVKGLVIVELSGDSVNLFTSNRDGMVEDYSNRLQSLANRLVESPKSAVKEKVEHLDHYKGDGAITVFGPKADAEAKARREKMEAVAAKVDTVKDQIQAASDVIDALGIPDEEKVSRLADMAKEQIRQELDEAGVSQAEPEIQAFIEGIGQEVKESLHAPMEEVSEKIVIKFKRLLQAVSYKPDFFVRRNKKLPRNIDPATWSKTYRNLALAWESVVKQVHIDMLSKEKPGQEIQFDFNIGWVEDREGDTAAERMQARGRIAYLLNPFCDFFRTSDTKELALELLDTAIHEIAHSFEGSHNERFIGIMDDIRRRTRRTDYVGLVASVLGRVA